MSAWAVKDATKSWEAVFDRAWAGEPQFVSRGDAQTVVVISLQSYRPERSTRRHAVLDALRSCPCGDELSGLINERPTEVPSFFDRSGGFGEE